MVLDRQLYRPVITPRTNIEPAPPIEDPEILSDQVHYEDTVDQSVIETMETLRTEADRQLESELQKEFEEIAKEQEESHASATA